MKPRLILFLSLLFSLGGNSGIAQTLELGELQSDLAIFTGILEEALKSVKGCLDLDGLVCLKEFEN